MRFVFVEKVVPQVVLREHFGVSKDDHPKLGTSQCHVKSSRVVEETNTRGLIGSDTTEKDVILFSALETVNRGYFDFLVELRIQLTLSLHKVHNKSSLAFVWSDNTNLVRSESRIEECRDDLFHIFSLLAIQERCARCRDFLIRSGVEEVHGLFDLRPWELKAVHGPVTS